MKCPETTLKQSSSVCPKWHLPLLWNLKICYVQLTVLVEDSSGLFLKEIVHGCSYSGSQLCSFRVICLLWGSHKCSLFHKPGGTSVPRCDGNAHYWIYWIHHRHLNQTCYSLLLWGRLAFLIIIRAVSGNHHKAFMFLFQTSSRPDWLLWPVALLCLIIRLLFKRWDALN